MGISSGRVDVTSPPERWVYSILEDLESRTGVLKVKEDSAAEVKSEPCILFIYLFLGSLATKKVACRQKV